MDEYELIKKIYIDKERENEKLKEELSHLKKKSEYDLRSNVSFSSAIKNQDNDTTNMSVTCMSERENNKKYDFVEIQENDILIRNIQEKVI